MHQASISKYMLVPINGIIQFSENLLARTGVSDDMKKLFRMINNCAKLLMCHSQDLLDNKVLEGGEIVPMMRSANLKHLIEDTIVIHRM